MLRKVLRRPIVNAYLATMQRYCSSSSSSPPSSTVSIDRSSIYNPPEHSHHSDSELVNRPKGILLAEHSHRTSDSELVKQPKNLCVAAAYGPIEPGSLVHLQRETSSGIVDVYLLGITHNTEKSILEATEVVKQIKPSLLFLELCRDRADLLYLPESVFNAAAREAAKLGGIEVVLGDSQVILNPRDELMTRKLLRASELFSSIVAVVGRAHIPGIQTRWESEIGSYKSFYPKVDVDEEEYNNILSEIGYVVKECTLEDIRMGFLRP